MKSNIVDSLCKAARIIEQDGVDGIYSAINAIGEDAVFVLISYYRRIKMRSDQPITVDTFLLKNPDVATIGYQIVSGNPLLILVDLLNAVEIIEKNGIGSFIEIRKLLTEKNAITLTIAHLRKKAGSLESYPAPLGIDDEVKEILIDASLVA